MWSYFYRYPRLLLLTILLIIIGGTLSFILLPRMEDPEITQRLGLITTDFPGASVIRVENLVTEKLEEELGEVEEIEEIISYSQLGRSSLVIALESEVSKDDVDQVWSRIRDRLADAMASKLPEGVKEPRYEELLSKAYTFITAIKWELDSPANYAILSRFGEELEDKFRALPGTEKVELTGVPVEEIVVEVDPTSLSSRGLTPDAVSKIIQTSDAKVSAGQLQGEDWELLIKTNTELDTLERIRQIPLQLSDDGQQILQLGDIATVKKGFQDPPTDLAIIDGKPAAIVSALMESTQRNDAWSRKARQILDEFSLSLPDGLRADVVFDQNRYVDYRINNLFKNLMLGCLAILIVTLFMMGFRSGIIIGLSLPLTILVVFMGLQLINFPLHQMSVTGLVIALGLLIDNAIVIVDEMNGWLAQGVKSAVAVSRTARTLGSPLAASTVTTLMAFLPTVILPGDTGEFVRGVGLSVILALLGSLFISLTIIPAVVALVHDKWPPSILSEEGNSKSRGIRKAIATYWQQGFSHPVLTRFYRILLGKILRYPRQAILIALVLPLTGFLMAPGLNMQLFSPVDRDQFYIDFELPAHVSLRQTEQVARQARELILQKPSVKSVQLFLGESPPEYYYNLDRYRQDNPHYAHAVVNLKSFKNSQPLIEAVQVELNQTFPQARILVRQPQQGEWIQAPVEMRITGPDLGVLKALGQEARRFLIQAPGIVYTRDDLTDTLPTLNLSLNEYDVWAAKLNHTTIAQQLNTFLEGLQGGSVLEGSKELPVRVRLANRDRSQLEEIAALDILAPINSESAETAIPLPALNQFTLESEPASINHRNGQRINTVQGFIGPGVLPSEVLKDLRQRLADANFQIPLGYQIEFGGEFEPLTEALNSLMFAGVILGLLMTAGLVLSFNSFRAAGIIVAIAVCSIGLGLFALWLFSYPLGFMALLGTIGLVGVAINDSIVVLSSLKHNPQAEQGDRQAIITIVLHSTRHVLTTTLTTMVGFLPLMIDGGEFWPPLAVCITVGVAGATLLALSFVPCSYLLFLSKPGVVAR